ncbi:hypothetical protein EDD64_101197 [Effusibacillus lacus]|nr:hypothetical protein EDD64_101197 [Effusibacillus lacus]
MGLAGWNKFWETFYNWYGAYKWPALIGVVAVFLVWSFLKEKA